MEDLKNYEDLTPEQKKDLAATLSKARIKVLWGSMKTGLLLFAANLITILIGVLFLVDADPQIVVGYQTVTVIINAVYASLYFNKQVRLASDIVNEKIKEILKK